MRRFTIIIPTKDVALLKRAIRSINRSHDDADAWKIIVIDDGLAERPFQSENIQYLPGVKPFCFSRNVNLGIKAAPPDSDIFLMNDDAFFLTRNGLSELRQAVCEHDRLGIVTPVFTRVERTPSQRLGHLDPEHGLWIERSGYLTFAAAYLRRELITEVGYLDETFTGYGYEDNDLSLRSVLAGFDLGVLPSVVMGHGDEYGRSSLTFRTVQGVSSNKELFIMKWARELLGLSEEQKPQMMRLLKFI